MSPRKRKDDTQQLDLFSAAPNAPEPAPVLAQHKTRTQPLQPGLFFELVDANEPDTVIDADAQITDMVPFGANGELGFIETESVNAMVAMAGLSAHTQRAYQRWIVRYCAGGKQSWSSFAQGLARSSQDAETG